MRKAAIVIAILVLAMLVLWVVWSPKPPDLTGCTRVEIRYEAGALNHFFPGAWFEKDMMSKKEGDYVRSLDKWTLTDHERINALAKCIKEGAYVGARLGPVAGYGVYVTGYRGNTRAASFVMFTRTVRVHGYQAFSYSLDLEDMQAIEPPGIKTLKLRAECARNLGWLWLERMLRSRPSPPLPPRDPNHWCDDFAGVFRLHGKSDDYITKMFACPSAHSPIDANGTRAKPVDANLPSQLSRVWSSDYAMNPNCEPNSPKDTVLLFEAKPGWNQHGGPELFNFENHDPKGGCVLLNDGTVKFIRTREELAQLGWK